MPNHHNRNQSDNDTDREVEKETPEQVEVYKEVERFKLGIWLAKTFSLFVLAIVAAFVSMYGYVAVTTQVLGDLAGLGNLLGGFFEIIKVVVSP